MGKVWQREFLMNYKDKFYKDYVTTHVLPRKGETTLDEFKWRAVMYQKQFGKFLPKDKNSKIIDLGCGNGSVVWWLLQSNYINTYGIEISTEQIETGKKLGLNNIEQADIEEFLKDKKDSYDIIFARDVLEHFNKEDIVKILSLCQSALKNNGKIIVQVPNAESPFGMRIRYGDFTHEIAFTSSSLSQLLRMTGYDNIQFYPRGPILFGVRSLIRFILWKFVEICYKTLLFAEIGRTKKIVTQDIIAVACKEVSK